MGSSRLISNPIQHIHGNVRDVPCSAPLALLLDVLRMLLHDALLLQPLKSPTLGQSSAFFIKLSDDISSGHRSNHGVYLRSACEQLLLQCVCRPEVQPFQV